MEEKEVFGYPVSDLEYQEFKAMLESEGWLVLMSKLKSMMAETAEKSVRSRCDEYESGYLNGTYQNLEMFLELKDQYRSQVKPK